MGGEEIQQLLQVSIYEFPVRVAPFAVFFVECAVRFPADIGILQRHSAALSEQLPRRAQQGIDGYVKQL